MKSPAFRLRVLRELAGRRHLRASIRAGLLVIGEHSIGDPLITPDVKRRGRGTARRLASLADHVRLARWQRRQLVEIGAHVRGMPRIKHYGGSPARAIIGPYATIGSGAELFVDGYHHVDWVTTFPLPELLELGSGTHLHNNGDVVVGPGAWIGAQSTLMGGVRVGPGAVVAPHAVVTRDVAPYTVVAGNPAQARGARFEDPAAAELIAAEWWIWPDSDVLTHPLALAPPAPEGFAAAGGIARVARDVARGRLPARYELELREPAFELALRGALRAGMTVLDVGAGAAPSLPPSERSPNCTWIGQDIVGGELAKAPAGSFDELSVGSITDHDPALDGRFDLIAARFVFEHVRPLALAVEHLRRYLRPGGRLIALLSGSWSVFALLNRVLSPRLARRAMRAMLGRDPETVFEAHYDGCSQRGLERMLRDWGRADVGPHFCGAGYFTFSRHLMAGYVAAEEVALRLGCNELATYYLVDAER